MREREVKSCRSEANHYAKPSQHEERRQRKLGRESDASTLVAPLIILTSEWRLHTQHQTDRQTADCEGASHTSRCEMRWRAKRHQLSHQHASPSSLSRFQGKGVNARGCRRGSPASIHTRPSSREQKDSSERSLETRAPFHPLLTWVPAVR